MLLVVVVVGLSSGIAHRSLQICAHRVDIPPDTARFRTGPAPSDSALGQHGPFFPVSSLNVRFFLF